MFFSARDGLRWHPIERAPGQFDFSSAAPMIKAARVAGVQVIWDLCHNEYRDGLDPGNPEFVRRFAQFAGAFARTCKEEFDEPPLIVPVNEISFWSWAGGTVAYLNPLKRRRGMTLKKQFVRMAFEAMEAI